MIPRIGAPLAFGKFLMLENKAGEPVIVNTDRVTRISKIGGDSSRHWGATQQGIGIYYEGDTHTPVNESMKSLADKFEAVNAD